MGQTCPDDYDVPASHAPKFPASCIREPQPAVPSPSRGSSRSLAQGGPAHDTPRAVRTHPSSVGLLLLPPPCSDFTSAIRASSLEARGLPGLGGGSTALRGGGLFHSPHQLLESAFLLLLPASRGSRCGVHTQQAPGNAPPSPAPEVTRCPELRHRRLPPAGPVPHSSSSALTPACALLLIVMEQNRPLL